MKNSLVDFLKAYLCERPLFLSLLRAKEAALYQKYLPLKHPILDFGCGDGFFAKVAFGHHRLTRIIDVGLDIKESRMEEARKLNIYKKIIVYDGKRIPFPNEYFSTVISNCVLEHVPDLNLVLNEISRVLKPGGLFITTVATKNWEEYLLGNIFFGDLYKKWMRRKQQHFNLLRDEVWTDVFTKRRFTIEEKTGYLNKKAVQLIDLFHYLSLSSLLTYRLFDRWVIWKNKFKIIPLDWFINLLSSEVKVKEGGNVFFTLVKH